jgi:hypothetical protein
MNCPGSVELSKTAPPGAPSPYALEGTAAHTLAELSLDQDENPSNWLGGTVQGHEVTQDMVNAVTLFVDRCKPLMEWYFGLEARVKLDPLWLPATPPSPMFGTVDFWALIDKTLYVIDYKHGKGVRVSAVNNSQIRYYALALLLELELFHTIDEVHLEIVQPRADPAHPTSEEVLPVASLKEWGHKVLKPAVAEALKPDAPRAVGSWCRFCPASGTCPTRYEKHLADARTEFEPIASTPTTIDGDRISHALKTIPLLQDWIKTVQAEAKRRLSIGQKIPHFKLVERQGNRTWVDEADVTSELLRMGLQLDDFEKTKILSPAQVDTLLKQCDIEITDDLAALTQPGPSSSILVRDKDPRPEVDTGFKPLDCKTARKENHNGTFERNSHTSGHPELSRSLRPQGN